MIHRPARRRHPLAATAAVGVVVGHWAAYAISVPGASTRSAVLAESGHGYWLYAVKAAVIFAVVAAGSLVVRQVSRRLRHRPEMPESGFALWGRLSLLQVVAFTAMEIAERLVAHAPVSSMFSHDLFAVGLVLQVAVALMAALVLRWLSGTIEHYIQEYSRSAVPRLPAVLARIAPSVQRTGSAPAWTVFVRGPPALLVA